VPDTNVLLTRSYVDICDGKAPGLRRFLGALLWSLHGWNDRAQQEVPGFRDRIATVQHLPHEGGMNLRMHPSLISGLALRGTDAGAGLARNFGPSPPTDVRTTWANHRWVRFRNGAKLIEEALVGIAKQDQALTGSRESLPQLFGNQPSYALYGQALSASKELYAQLVKLGQWLIQVRQTTGSSAAGPVRGQPKPTTELRVRPRV
jgi:hypothetical protein